MERLEIGLLGGFELRRDGQVLDPLTLRAARSLLAFLVLNRERAHTRDLLAGTFWPDFDEPRARRRLSQALWQIQKTLGEEEGQRYLIGTADTVRFNPETDFWLDVDEFTSALDQAAKGDRGVEAKALAHAVSMYRGDLLSGFYDDWLFHDQDRLRTRFLGALERLADLAVARGEYEPAIVHARRLAQENEFDEEAHRRVMRIAVLLGRHNEAIQQFEECRRILAEELGAEPSAETVEMYEATIAARDSASRAVSAPEEFPLFEEGDASPFVGREGERSIFAERLDAVLEGSGRILLVEGEAGVGKTRLLQGVATDAQWRGMDVVWGRSAPHAGRPFGPIGDALRTGLTDLRVRQLANRLDPTRLSALAPLIPSLAPDAPPGVAMGLADEQARMYEAIGAAFQSLAATNPSVVVLEDIHWADEDTLQALEQVAQRIEDDQIFFAVTYRHGEARERSEVWNMLRALDRLAYCDRISLAALTPAQTEELIRRSLGKSEISGAFSERLHRDTGGVPLFVLETLRAMYERDTLQEADEPAEGAPPSAERLPLSPTVHSLIKQRLGALEEPSRRTVDLLAVHSGQLLVEEIIQASELTQRAALEALDDLHRRRLIEGSDSGFTLDHELIRRVIYEELPLSRRLDLHRRIGASIESYRDEEVELLAYHFNAARMPDKAAVYLEKAAQQALAAHAYDSAAQHLAGASLALDAISASPSDRFRVAQLNEEVLSVLGRRDEQGEVLRRLERYSDDHQRVEVLRRRAWWLAHQDRFDEATEAAESALALAETTGDPNQVIPALTALGMIACYGGKAAEGVAVLEDAAGHRDASIPTAADARNALGQNLMDLQRFGEAESQLLAAVSLYRDLEDARGEAEVLGTLGAMRMERGESGAAEADLREAVTLSERIGYRHGEAVGMMNLGILFIITNRLKAAIDALEEAASRYAAMGNRRGRALVFSNSAWLWHGLIGDDEKAERRIEEALQIYREIGDDRGIAHCLTLRASVVGRRGDLEDSQKLFAEALTMTRAAQDAWLSAQALREMAAVELENHAVEIGFDHARQAEQLCREYGMNDLLVGVRALAGRLALRLGRTDEALDWATKAIREIRPGVELAHLVPLTLSEVYGAMGNDAEASHYITLAHDQLEQLLDGLDEPTKTLSWEQIPNHRAIKKRWLELQPRLETIVLPRSDAPLGRGLSKAEHIEVTWTIHEPFDEQIEDRVERRRHQIKRLIDQARDQGASPTTKDLAGALDSGDATIRRDLQAMREQGLHVPTRGSRS